jgi:UDP-glucose 4-epimerase
VLDLIERVAGKSASVRRLPDRKVDVAGTQLNCKKLAAESGWAPKTSLEDGIRVTWEWVRTLPYERRL